MRSRAQLHYSQLLHLLNETPFLSLSHDLLWWFFRDVWFFNWSTSSSLAQWDSLVSPLLLSVFNMSPFWKNSQVWRGALARMRCRRMRAIYAIMGCYKRYKVKAHFWEVESRFANVRTMADYGKSVEWPNPPAALSKFHKNTVMLHRRSDPTKWNSYSTKTTI